MTAQCFCYRAVNFHICKKIGSDPQQTLVNPQDCHSLINGFINFQLFISRINIH